METLICNYCGRPCLKDAIVSANPTEEPKTAYLIMCPQCFMHTKTCALCQESTTCDFETNSDPSPKQIQQTIRQGQMVIQTAVINPERVQKTCKVNCKCWNDDLGCLKQNGTCGNYKEIIPIQ